MLICRLYLLLNQLQKVNKSYLTQFLSLVHHIKRIRMQRIYPVKLRFQTHQFLYQFLWQKENYLTVDIVQVSQPQNTYYGELKNEEIQPPNDIRRVFLHLSQIVDESFSKERDFISPILQIFDASKEYNRVEYKLKVKLCNKQKSEIIIPLIFKLRSLQVQKNRDFYLMQFMMQTCSLNSQKSKNIDQTDFKQDKCDKKKKRKFKIIEKVIRNESKRRQLKKMERKMLSKKRSDQRKLEKISKMLQEVEIK